MPEREAEVLTADAKEKIAKFDAALSTKNESESNKAQGQGFCGGICFALAVIVVRHKIKSSMYMYLRVNGFLVL